MVCLGRSDIPFQSERIEPYIQTKHSARTPRTMLQRYIRMLHMLQWFVHVCCKCLFSMFYLFFRRMLQMCLSGYCICFTHMLQLFYLDVAYVLQWVSRVFRVSYACFKCFICLFICWKYCKCFKSRSGIAHGMHVSGRERERAVWPKHRCKWATSKRRGPSHGCVKRRRGSGLQPWASGWTFGC